MDKLRTEDPPRIGPYRLIGRLGSGGMGRVYLARSDGGRTVAVKLIQSELAQREEFRQRFTQEVAAARRVGGQWTAPVLGADTEADTPWVATAYIPGPSLQSVVDVEYGPLPASSVRALANGLAHALHAIHDAGLIHRDLKPSNILLTIDGPRVIDFGIVHALNTLPDSYRTRAGAVMGSPGFMAPEQVRGDGVSPASDVFCLGAVLAYASTGRPPFGTAGDGLHALMFRIAEEEPDLVGLPEGPDAIGALVRGCLAKDPRHRPTPDELVARTPCITTEPWLPGSLLALLGRRAGELLDFDSDQDQEGEGEQDAHPGERDPEPERERRQGERRGERRGERQDRERNPGPGPDPQLVPMLGDVPTFTVDLSGPQPPPLLPFLPPAPSAPPTQQPRTRRTPLVLTASAVATLATMAVIGVVALLTPDPGPGPGLDSRSDNDNTTPIAFAGAWEGVIKDSGADSATLFGRIVVSEAAVGAKAVDFLLLGDKALCEGASTLVSRAAGKMVLNPGTTSSIAPSNAPATACAPLAQQTLTAGGTVANRQLLNWRAGGLTATLTRAVTGSSPISEAYLGTWRPAGPRSAGKDRITIRQGPIGTAVARTVRTTGGKQCAYDEVLVSVSDSSLVFGPYAAEAPAPAASCTLSYSHTYTRTNHGLRVSYPDSAGADSYDLVRVD
ncbi:serine/threonine-protein kinase [Streptomyces sp. NPDC088725]|uniref:serine/threonine-protein kinase n=1 Tax=Streptomyces sp. NPDC088725 TaxID=3365873 RepID=UPI0037FE7E12